MNTNLQYKAALFLANFNFYLFGENKSMLSYQI